MAETRINTGVATILDKKYGLIYKHYILWIQIDIVV